MTRRDATSLLLLCPPGRVVYIRDIYCSHRSKADYYWYPYDLVVQSSFLTEVGPLEVLDATAKRLSPQKALESLSRGRYHAVLALVGSVSWSEDEAFLRDVHELTQAPIYVSGDVVSFNPRKTLDALPFLEGVLLDYTSPDLARHLNGGGRNGYSGLYLKGEQVDSRPSERAVGSNFSIPLPRWDLFPHRCYRMPFLKKRPFASVAASFGCPHDCSFCSSAALRFKKRSLDNCRANVS